MNKQRSQWAILFWVSKLKTSICGQILGLLPRARTSEGKEGQGHWMWEGAHFWCQLCSCRSLVTPPCMVGLGALPALPPPRPVPSLYNSGLLTCWQQKSNIHISSKLMELDCSYKKITRRGELKCSWHQEFQRYWSCFSSSLSSAPMYYSLRISYTCKISSWFCFSRESWLI